MTAVGVATMIGGINVCNLNANTKLQSVDQLMLLMLVLDIP